MSHVLDRPALGQKAALGTLYNAHTDTFQTMSLFSSALPAGLIDLVPQRKASTALDYSDSYQGRCSSLGISPDLGASLFSGLAHSAGSGACLDEQPNAADKFADSASNTVDYAALHHRISTADEHLHVRNPALRDLITTACLQRDDFTHVVIGITWGCHTVITARRTVAGSGAAPTAETTAPEMPADHDAFVRAMNRLKNAIDELQYNANPDLSEIEHIGTPIDVMAYSEAFDGRGIMLDGLRGAFDLIQLLPSLLQHNGQNNGKGEPVAYSLLPIQAIADFFKVAAQQQSVRNITQDFLCVALEQFDNVNIIRSTLAGHASFLARNRPYVPASLAHDVETTIKTVAAEMAELRQAFSGLLVQGRKDDLDRAAASTLVQRLAELASICTQTLDLAAGQRAKIAFANTAVARGAVFVGRDRDDLDTFLRASAAGQREAYVLRYNKAAITADEDAWKANQLLLWSLLDRKTKPQNEVLVLDCDAANETLDRLRIVHHDREGIVVTEDLHEQQQFEAGHSFARWASGTLETGDVVQRPVVRCIVKIPCPGKRCDQQQPCQWLCSKCHATIEFGFADDYLYCDCGRAKFDKWQFKCNGTKHQEPDQGRKTKKKMKNNKHSSSDGYVSHSDEARFLSLLKSLDQADYVNILVLGETGVGKSTFINALVNYLSFETLDEAMLADELSWVVPCAFSIQTMDRSRPNGAIEMRKIHVGERDDEADGSAGASATQQTAVYPINVGGRTIRLIDTPGIGDTRGLAFDKKNMADILRTLSGYEKLHGILILVKSNNARLTVMFNFCMQELLTHLHRNASRNMAFGFTNTRISNYSPGDTFGPLTALLDKYRDIGIALENQNTYCFDSESFRFLAAFKNGTTMEHEEDFRRSWQFSRTEAVRMIDFFATRPPHPVKSTMSLNGTRNSIAELTKPMAEISQTINTSIKLCSDQINELRHTKMSGDKLRRRLQVPKVHLKTVKLDKPRTVCRNESCVEWRDDGTGTVIRMYTNPCHDPCYLTNVEVDRVNCPELMRCRAFHHSKSGNCRQPTCGHSWQEHLHVYFELKEYTAMVTDTEAQRLYDQNKSNVTVKEAAVKTLEARIVEYQAEHDQIQQAAARFGLFLKKHSITPYNDATLEYLDLLIQEEKQKAQISHDTDKLTQLREAYTAHIELVKTLESNMAGDSSEVVKDSSGDDGLLDEAGVEALVCSLYSLEHFGAMLRNVKDGIATAHQATYRERPFKVSRSSTRRMPSKSELGQASAVDATSRSYADVAAEHISHRGSERLPSFRKWFPW